MGVEGEGWVEQDPEVSYKGGGTDGTAINGEDEVTHFLEGGLGCDNHEFCFTSVKFQEIDGHPVSDFMETGDERRGWQEVRWFGVEVELGVVGVTVVVETMFLDDLAKREEVDGEEQGTKD